MVGVVSLGDSAPWLWANPVSVHFSLLTNQPAAHPSSTLSPLPSPKQTKPIVSTGAVGAGWSASRRPQAEVPSARAPPDTQDIVLWSTALGHLSLAPGLSPHPSPPATVLRHSQPGAQGSQLTVSPPTHTPSSPLWSYNCLSPSCCCHSLSTASGVPGGRQLQACRLTWWDGLAAQPGTWCSSTPPPPSL